MGISFREVEIDDARMILDWRTSPRVSKYMITEVAYDIEAQKRWIAGIYARTDYYAWVVLYDSDPVGFINIQNFDFQNLQTSWGFYKGVTGFPGVGAKVLPFLYNWLFFTVGIRNISTTVFYENTKAMDLYLRYGHTLLPEKDRIVHKCGREMLLATLALSLDAWDKEKYAGSLAPFPTQHWMHSSVLLGVPQNGSGSFHLSQDKLPFTQLLNRLDVDMELKELARKLHGGG